MCSPQLGDDALHETGAKVLPEVGNSRGPRGPSPISDDSTNQPVQEGAGQRACSSPRVEGERLEDPSSYGRGWSIFQA